MRNFSTALCRACRTVYRVFRACSLCLRRRQSARPDAHIFHLERGPTRHCQTGRQVDRNRCSTRMLPCTLFISLLPTPSCNIAINFDSTECAGGFSSTVASGVVLARVRRETARLCQHRIPFERVRFVDRKLRERFSLPRSSMQL